MHGCRIYVLMSLRRVLQTALMPTASTDCPCPRCEQAVVQESRSLLWTAQISGQYRNVAAGPKEMLSVGKRSVEAWASDEP
jgi:hypothetical protein